MNERIEKLAIECYQAPEFDYKKFAELIIKECMAIGFHTVYKVDNDNAAVAVYQNIKEHFGVEE
jgi:hypothetical protein